MVVPKHLRIGNVSADERAYVGASATGQLQFVEDGAGWYLWDDAELVYKQAGS